MLHERTAAPSSSPLTTTQFWSQCADGTECEYQCRVTLSIALSADMALQDAVVMDVVRSELSAYVSSSNVRVIVIVAVDTNAAVLDSLDLTGMAATDDVDSAQQLVAAVADSEELTDDIRLALSNAMFASFIVTDLAAEIELLAGDLDTDTGADTGNGDEVDDGDGALVGDHGAFVGFCSERPTEHPTDRVPVLSIESWMAQQCSAWAHSSASANVSALCSASTTEDHGLRLGACVGPTLDISVGDGVCCMVGGAVGNDSAYPSSERALDLRSAPWMAHPTDSWSAHPRHSTQEKEQPWECSLAKQWNSR